MALLSWFIANWVVGILLLEYALYKTKAVRKVDESRDSKYPAFRRWDVKKWNRPTFYLGIIPLFTCTGAFLILPKALITLFNIIIFVLYAK